MLGSFKPENHYYGSFFGCYAWQKITSPSMDGIVIVSNW